MKSRGGFMRVKAVWARVSRLPFGVEHNVLAFVHSLKSPCKAITNNISTVMILCVATQSHM
ncbi:uncharacterized protein EI90DRAFT_3080695, partial [Cantharellus anzutake]|uniref:uncharacterized protein n=1 Tax=Cantharellus anzutake TaxID=1750568 RepID=UPI00190477CD